MADLQKPGQTPDRSGEYEERGPRGGRIAQPRQVTIEPGDNPLPPTSEKATPGSESARRADRANQRLGWPSVEPRASTPRL